MPHAPALSLRRYGPSPGSHSHAHFQVLWGWQGVLELEVEGRGQRIDAGRIAVIAPGERHDFQAAARAASGARCFVFDGHDERLEPLAGRLLHGGSALMPLLQFLAAQRADDPALWRHAAPLLLHALPQAIAPASRGRRIDWDRLGAWVDARLHEPLTVAELAAQACLSPAQFAARCLDQWRCPPQAWVRQRRLGAARRWRAEGLSVAETARRCGYRSASALTAALRRTG